jgi:N-acetylmuramoyl-L-alanine amidase
MVTDGSNNSPQAAAREANEWGADLFVSIHNNAGGGDGYEALVGTEEQRVMGWIFERFVKEIGQNSRGVKLRPDLTVLRDTKMPAILNEGAFVDNQKDIADWNEAHELKRLGIAYGKAAAEYLKLEKRKPEVEVCLPVLSTGSKGASVSTLQCLLKHGNFQVGITGNFGNGTKGALQKAQKAYGLPQTGKTDAETWKALLGLLEREERDE